jgi:hypothetical protein
LFVAVGAGRICKPMCRKENSARRCVFNLKDCGHRDLSQVCMTKKHYHLFG